MNIIKNASMKVKLFALSLPLIIAVILSVIMASYKIDNTAKEVTGLYYDKLYTINTNLINADRDFYQAMSAAAKYHEASAGFVYIRSPHTGSQRCRYRTTQIPRPKAARLIAAPACKTHLTK